MTTNASILVGTSADVYQYLGGLKADGLIDFTGGALTSGVGLIAQWQAPHGPICGLYTKEVESAALSGATSNVGTNFINASGSSSMPLCITLYNTVLITGASAYTAGDGTTADLFGTALPLVVGDTVNLMKTAGTARWYTGNVNLVLTATTADFTAGKVRAAMLYLKRGALLS